jgi:hypothetical protein
MRAHHYSDRTDFSSGTDLAAVKVQKRTHLLFSFLPFSTHFTVLYNGRLLLFLG